MHFLLNLLKLLNYIYLLYFTFHINKDHLYLYKIYHSFINLFFKLFKLIISNLKYCKIILI